MAIVTQALLAVQAFVLGLLVLAGWATVPVVWGLTLVVGVVGAFENPARRGLVTELVEPVDIANATSLNTAVMTGSRIFGPALGRVLVDTVGTAWCFLLNGGVVRRRADLAVRAAHGPAVPRATVARGGRPVRDALGFVRPQPPVVRDVRRDGGRVDVRLQLRRGPARAGRRAVGRRELVRSRAVGDRRRLVRRVAADGPACTRLDALVPRQHGPARRRRPRDGVGAEPVAALLWAIPLGIGGGGFISGGNGIAQQESPPDMRGRLLGPDRGRLPRARRRSAGRSPASSATPSAPAWALAYGSLITLATAAGAGVVLARAPHGAIAGRGVAGTGAGRLAVGRVECQMLDDRKTAILSAVVQEYIATALPVGSTHIADAPGVRVSSATVRNEMAVLEQEGYLVQPHTSAGRIPTDKGYRFFVDHLGDRRARRPLHPGPGRRLLPHAHGRLEEMLHRTSDLLAHADQLRRRRRRPAGRRPSRCAACSSCACRRPWPRPWSCSATAASRASTIEPRRRRAATPASPRRRPTSPAS